MGTMSRHSPARKPWLTTVVLIALTACGDARSSARLQSAAAEGAEARAVRAARAAQNLAIAALDTAKVASFWTEDVEIRSGHGGLVVGRDAYRNLFKTDSGAIARGEELIYQREPVSVEISAQWPLAFEEGSWTGHFGRATGPVLVGGRYAAQWVKRNGRWLIRGEIYVALTCAGAECASPIVP